MMLSNELAESVNRLEAELRLPVWLLLQSGQPDDPQDWAKDSFHIIGDTLTSAFFAARHGALKRGQPIALLIDSNGGMARSAYELAMLIRRHCGGFVAIIPRHAKSAATLLTLGADSIMMNDHAELGPLDVQVFDADREEWLSGLDEVQALERLNAFAMGAFDKLMFMLIRRTRKKANTILPIVSNFVTRMVEPMFNKVDVVRFTQMSRTLKIAEEYGKRLLTNAYGPEAVEIARQLVESYPEHGFPIYRDEIREIGLRLAPLKGNVPTILEEMTKHLSDATYIGKIQTA